MKINYFDDIPEWDFSKLTHREIKSSDVILPPLWNKSNWIGIMATTQQQYFNKPLIGLIFKNKNGLDIFARWKKDNSEKKITIGIISGIDKNHPYWYRVLIGENPNGNNEQFKLIITINRCLTVTAKDSNTLNILKNIIRNHKNFLLLPMLKDDMSKDGKIRMEWGIPKQIESIIYKNVSEINESDNFLINGLQPEDTPVNNSENIIFAEKIIEYLKTKRK